MCKQETGRRMLDEEYVRQGVATALSYYEWGGASALEQLITGLGREAEDRVRNGEEPGEWIIAKEVVYRTMWEAVNELAPPEAG